MAEMNELTALVGLMNQGFTPEQARAQMEEAKAMQFAKLSPEERISMMGYRGARQLGQGISSLFGVQQEDPMLKTATQVRQLGSQFDLQTSQGWADYSKALQSVSPQMAQQAALKSIDLKKKEAEIGKLTAETSKAMTEGLTPDQRNAAALADSKGLDRGTRAWSEEYRSQLERLTTKEGSLSDIGRLYKEMSNLDPVKDAPKINAYTQLINNKITETNTEFREADGRVGLYDKVTGKLIKDIGKAPARGTNVTVGLNMKEPLDITKFRNSLLDTVKKPKEAYDAAGSAITLADEALNNDNFAAASALARQLAKAAGEQQLSAADVRAFGIDPSLVGSVADVATKLATGRPTADTLRKLRQLAVVLRQKQASVIQRELDTQRGLAEEQGFKPNDIDKAFTGILESAPKGKARTTRSGVQYTVED